MVWAFCLRPIDTRIVPHRRRSLLNLNSNPGLYGRAYALPALRAWFSVRTEPDIQSCNELKRAKGPADNSHARKGVVRVADKDEG